MDRHYQQFGQGLTMRGNERPSIPTTGGAWGANYNYADLSQRHFLIPRDMNRPTIRTAFGLSTEQRAYNNILHPTSRSSFNAGLTGTGGIFGANGAGIRQMNVDGTIFGPTGHGTGGIVGANGHGIRIPTNGIVGANGHGIRIPTNGIFGANGHGIYKAGTTNGLNKRKKSRKSKKSRKRRSKRRTGGYYEDIRRAINKASTGGLNKRKRKSSKHTTRRRR